MCDLNNPKRIAELVKRSGDCLSILIGADGKNTGISQDELIFMYNVLAEMVNGLVSDEEYELEDEETEEECDCCDRCCPMQIVCPRCGCDIIDDTDNFCRHCGILVAVKDH